MKKYLARLGPKTPRYYRGEVNAHEFEKRYLRWFRHGNQ